MIYKTLLDEQFHIISASLSEFTSALKSEMPGVVMGQKTVLRGCDAVTRSYHRCTHKLIDELIDDIKLREVIFGSWYRGMMGINYRIN